MKTNKHVILNILRTIVLAFCLILLATCDVGLGPSIDTDAPEVTVDNPKPGTVVNGKFVFTGTAKDDGIIKSVEVVFEGLGTSEGKNYNFKTDSEEGRKVSVGDNKWKLTVDSTGSTPVEDGTYSLTVTVLDESGKSTSQKATFTVDNTPPVVIVTSPDEKNDVMNYDIQIDGKIYDATEIKSITVSLYDAAGTEKVSEEAKLTGSGTWTVTFDGDKLKAGTKDTKLTDGTYKYFIKAVDEQDNTSTYFFHKEDIYENLPSGTQMRKLVESELAEFDKGTTSVFYGITADKLPDLRIGVTSTEELKGSIPVITYYQRKLASIKWQNIGEDVMLNEGDWIIGSISPETGVDAPFKNDTFKAYILDEEIAQNDNGTAKVMPSESFRVPDDFIEITNAGSNRNFKIKTEGKGGGNYFVYIQIENSNRTPYGSQEQFGINLSSPKLDIKEPADLKNGLKITTKDKTMLIKGTALISTGDAGCNLTYTIRKDGGEESSPQTITTDKKTGAWSLALPQEDGTYEYTFTAESKGFTSTKQRTLVLDTTAPDVNILQLTPSSDGTKVTVNGTANDVLSGFDTSKGAEFKYCFIEATKTPKDSDWKVPVKAGGTSFSFYTWKFGTSSWDIDTTNLPETEHKLYVRMKDSAGNEKTVSSTILIDKSNPQATITVEGDTTNAQKFMTNGTGTEADGSKYVLFSGTADDFKITAGRAAESVKLEYSKDGETSVAVTSGLVWDKTTGAWSYKLPVPNDPNAESYGTADGDYDFTLTVTDIAGKTTSVKKRILLDTLPPELTVTSPLEGESLDSAYKIEGTVRDDGSKFDENCGVFYTFNKDDDNSWTLINVGTGVKWATAQTIQPPADEGTQHVYLKAVDKLGNATAVEDRKYYFDDAAPAINSAYVKKSETEVSDTTDIVAIKETFWLGGTWTETNELKSITITSTKIGGEKQELATLTPAGTDTDPNKGSNIVWEHKVEVPNHLNSGLYEITITAEDGAEKKTSVIKRVRIDLVQPEDPEIDDVSGGEINPYDNKTYYGKDGKEVTIRGTARDGGEDGAQSGITIVQYSLTDGTDDSVWTDCIGTTTWSATIPAASFTEEKAYTIYFRSIDGSGFKNEGYETKSVYTTVNIDKESPRGTIDVVEEVDGEGNSLLSDGEKATLNSGTFTTNGTNESNSRVLFGGTADDAAITTGRAASSIALSYSKDGGASVDVTSNVTWNNTDPESPDFGKWSYAMPTDLGDGNYTFTLSVTDIAGKSVTKTKNIILDTTGPVISTSLSDKSSFTSLSGNNVTASCFDQDAGLDEERKFYWKLNDGDQLNLITGSTATIVFQNQGTNQKITFVAYDKIGNKKEEVRTELTVDSNTPTLDPDFNVDDPDSSVFNTAKTYLKKGDSFSLLKAIGTEEGEVPSGTVVAHDDIVIERFEVIAKQKIGTTETVRTGEGQESDYWYKWQYDPAVDGNEKTDLTVADLQDIPAFVATPGEGTANGPNDGTWVVTVTVYDRNGNVDSSNQKTFNFTIDATPPTISIKAPETTLGADEDAASDEFTANKYIYNGNNYLRGTTVTLTGECEQTTDVVTGIKHVRLYFNGSSESEEASVTERTWRYTLDLSKYNEGPLTLEVEAEDNAGNISTTRASASFKIDQNKPVSSPITIKIGDVEMPSEWLKGNFTVSGKVTDTCELSEENFSLSVKRTYTENGEEKTEDLVVTPNLVEVSDKEYTWSCEITDVESGSYTITVNAKDLSGKKATTVTRTIKVDTNKPVVNISNLNENSLDILSGDSFTFRGTAKDKPDGEHAGVSVLKYRTYAADPNSTPGDDEGWKNVTTAEIIPENWTLPLSFGKISEGKDLEEGKYIIEIHAEDSAGNVTRKLLDPQNEVLDSEESYNVARTFMVDLADPALEMSNAANLPEYINEDLTINGTISDSNPLSVGEHGTMSLHLYINEEPASLAEFTRGTTSELGTWSFTLRAPADHSNDGKKIIKIVASDAAGKTKEITKTITVDTTPPVINEVNPGSVLREFTLQANIYDTGKGIPNELPAQQPGGQPRSPVKYSFNENADDADWLDMTLNSTSGMYEAAIAKSVLDEDGEGSKTVYIKATDGLNPAVKPMTFYYDLNYPQVDETSVGTGGLTTNGDTEEAEGNEEQFKLIGYVFDSNDLASDAIVITADKGNLGNITLAKGDMTPVDASASHTPLANGAEPTGWYKWEQTFTVDGKNETGIPHLADGTYVFTITAKDVASKTAQIQRTVVVDTVAPAFTETNGNVINYTGTNFTTGTDGKTWWLSSTVKIETAATDATSKISTVEYQIGAGEPSALTNTSGKWNVALPLTNEGNNQVRLIAKDKAGNAAYYPSENTFEDIYVDTAVPSVTIDENVISPTNGGVEKEFTLSGFADDSNALSTTNAITITAKKAGSVYKTFALNLADMTLVTDENRETLGATAEQVGSYKWTKTFAVGGANEAAANYIEDGTYTFIVTVQDVAKRTSSDEKTIQVDTTAPNTLSISAPANGTTGNSSLSGTEYDFRGTVRDSSNGSGIAKISYAFVKAEDAIDATAPAAPTEASSWTDYETAAGAWSITKELVSGTDEVSGKLCEGHWYFFIKAVDKAGNESAEPVSIHFHVDMTSPVLAVTTDGIKDKENGTYYYKTQIIDDTPTDADKFMVAGTWADSYGIDKVTVKVGNGEPAEADLNDNYWSYTVSSITSDTAIPLTVTAIDKSGKTAVKKYTLYRDTTPPDLEIITPSPTAGESFLSNILNLKGTASDEGSGVKSISYNIKKDGALVDAEPEKSGTITFNGETWVLNGVDFSKEDENTHEPIIQEGTFILTVTATDNTDTESTVTSTFYVDKEKPTVTETVITATGMTTNGDTEEAEGNEEQFKLAGYVYDSNDFASDAIVITADKGTLGNITLAKGDMTPVDASASHTPLANGAEPTGWYKWEQTFTVDGNNTAPHLADGTYTFTITAKDVAGKTDVIQRTVTVDTKAPVFDPTSGNITCTNNSTSFNNITWYESSLITASVYASDPNASENETGSGFASIKYEIEGGREGYFKDASTNEAPNKWDGDITLKEGENRIRIIATDVAGNKAYYPSENGYETFYADTQNPSISITNGADELAMSQFYLSGYVYDSNALYSGNSGSAVTIAAGEGETGFPETGLALSDNTCMIPVDATSAHNELTEGATPTGWYKWTKTFVVGSSNSSESNYVEDGTYNLTITATDAAGHTYNVTKKVTVDTEAPVFSMDSEIITSDSYTRTNSDSTTEKWYGTANLDIEGFVTDANEIKSVQWSWEPNGTYRFFNTSEDTQNNGNSNVRRYKFEGVVTVRDTTKSLRNGTLYIKATDQAGNVTTYKAVGAQDPGISGIYVDLDYPTVSVTATDPAANDGTLLLNGNNPLEVTIAVTDRTEDNNSNIVNGSGIKSVKYKFGSSSNYPGDEDPTVIHGPIADGPVTFTIPASIIATGGPAETVYIQTVDYTGKTDSASFSYQLDNKDPEVTIRTPAPLSASAIPNNPLNKKISFSGTASDDNLLVVNLYYSTKYQNPPAMPNRTEDSNGNVTVENVWNEQDGTERNAATTQWVLLEKLEDATRYNWEKEIDTEQDQYNNPDEHTEKYIHFLVEAYDAAGNCDSHLAQNAETISRKVSTRIIDQNSDRPKVLLREISKTDGTGVLMGKRTVEFIVDDDDGAIHKLYVSPTGADGSWLECEENNGIWSYKYPDEGFEDGEKTLYLKVEDSYHEIQGENVIYGTFFSNTNDEKEAVLIKGKDELVYTWKKKLEFSVDTRVPDISTASVKIFTRKTGETLKAYDYVGPDLDGDGEPDEKVETFSSTKIVGGSKSPLIDLYATAYDSSGIRSVSAKISSSQRMIESAQHDLLATDILGNQTWRMSGIDISNFESGTYTLTITATDTTGSTGTYISSIRIDNDAPASADLSIVSTETKITGDFTLRVDAKDNMSGVKSVEYKIPPKTGDDDAAGWILMESSGTFWDVRFNGDDQLGTICNNSSTYGVTSPTGQDADGRYYWTVPIYFRMEDELGNFDYKKDFTLKVDPDGDIPVASILYPEPNEDPTRFTSLGGTIRIYGSAVDNEAIDSVYIQIDVDDNGFDITDKNTLAGMTAHGEPIYNITDDLGTDSEPAQDRWGIKVNGKESWSFSINGNTEYKDVTEFIRIRVRPKDNKGKFGNWSIVNARIRLDDTAPTIGSTIPLQLVQYENGTETAVQDYQPDASIKGTWYLRGSADDDGNIKSIKVDSFAVSPEPESGSNLNCNSIVTTIQVKKGDGSWATVPANGLLENIVESKNVEFRIPVNTLANDSRSLSFKIIVSDESDSTGNAQQPIYIKYDNQKPVIKDLYTDEARMTYKIGETNIIQNTNGVFTIYGKVEDQSNGSKFSKLAVYFRRSTNFNANDSDWRIYNPALETEPKTNGKEYNRTDIGSNISFNTDNLPVLTVATVTRVAGPDSEHGKLILGSGNPNIRVGGLVKIGGVYRLITEVSNDYKTVTFSPSVDTSYNTNVEFVFASIVDHVIVETKGADGSILNDDDDGIIESVEGNGNEKMWSISFDSRRIPDGPIQICCVAFDNAGNVSDFNPVRTKVANNRPLIANVWLGTDYDRSGTVEPTEFANINNVFDKYMSGQSFSFNSWKREAASVVLNEIGSFKAVGTTVIKPEIVGGNNELHFYYAKDPAQNSTDYTMLDMPSRSRVTLTHSKTSNTVTFKAAGKAVGAAYTWKVDGSTPTSGVSDDGKEFTFTAGTGSGEYSTEKTYTVTVTDGTLTATATVVVAYIESEYTVRNINYTSSAYVMKGNAGERAIPDQVNDTEYTTTEYPITLNLKCENDTMSLDGIGNGAHKFSFKIFDTTENCTGDADPLYVGGELQNTSQDAEFSVSFSIDVVDIVPPEATIEDFKWEDKDHNNIYYEDGKAMGHIELAFKDAQNNAHDWLASSFYDSNNNELDDDPKVSGIIKIKGTADDETCLQSISLKVEGFEELSSYKVLATYKGIRNWTETGDLATDGYHFKVTDNDDDLSDGHHVEWELVLDTSFVGHNGDSGFVRDYAAVDKSVHVKVYDTGNNDNTRKAQKDANGNLMKDANGEYIILPGTFDPPSKKMDIVPYITSLTTKLSIYDQNNPSVYARTSGGHYPVASDESITIIGFNLTGGTVYFTKENDSTALADYTVAYPANGVVAIPSGAKSGELYIKVKEIDTLNNKNNNNSRGNYGSSVDADIGDKSIYENYYNRQPNGINNNRLTDDVIIDIWQFDPQAVKPKVGGIEHPVMAISPTDKNIGFAFVGGTAYFSMPYGTNSKGVTPNSFEYWIGGLDAWNSVSLAYDINGYTYSTAAGGDLNTSKNGVDVYRFTTSRWDGKGTLSTNGYLDLNNQFGLEFIGEREYFKNESNSWEGFTNFSKERIKSPSLATVATKTDKTKATVYLAYYDSINDEIRFIWGIITNSKNTSDDTGMFATYCNTNGLNVGRKSQPYTLSGTSLIAGHTKKYTTAAANVDSPSDSNIEEVEKYVITTENEYVYAGEYVSIAAIGKDKLGENATDDAVVAVWWDGSHSKMLYSYNKKPKSINKGEYEQAETEWSPPVEIFSGTSVGEYCKVAVDPVNGVHIVAYDSTLGDIWYAYLKDYDSPSTAKIGYLDSYGFVGSELNIDVAMVDNKPVPYVSYYSANSAKPKIARWVGPDLRLATTTSVAGATNDLFTSNWETSYVPTTSKLTLDHINVGVWKTDDGVLDSSITGVKSFSSQAGSDKNSKGTVWGNGTSNPVLGYATKQGSLGYIETAQMK